MAPKARMRVLRARHELALKPKAHEVAAFQRGDEERTFKTKEFKDMPVVVTEVRNLQSETWYKDLEIEVKNVSSKPVYSILAYLEFPDVRPKGDGVSGIALEFGERKNVSSSRIAEAEDSHFNPGETFVFRIPDQFIKGLRWKQVNIPNRMKKLELDLARISFGDGTGFVAHEFRDNRIKRSHAEKNDRHHALILAERHSTSALLKIFSHHDPVALFHDPSKPERSSHGLSES